MDILVVKCCFILSAAIRGYSLSYLSSCAGRIRFLLGTPGMVALDIDASLKGLFQQIVHHLENLPKPQGENISAITCDLSVCGTSVLAIFQYLSCAMYMLFGLQCFTVIDVNILAFSY